MHFSIIKTNDNEKNDVRNVYNIIMKHLNILFDKNLYFAN